MGAQPLTLAFIGGGLRSAVGRTHFIASRMDRRFDVVAGSFSRDPEVNAETGRIQGIDPARTYDDWREMIAAEAGQVDAVVVLTPTPDHGEGVIAALEAGIPVICEKALAETSSRALEIERVREKLGGFVAVTFNYTGYPMLRELQYLVSDGALGKIEQVHVEMPQESFSRLTTDGARPTPQSWRLKDIGIPTVALDLGVHLLNLVEFLTGEKPAEATGLQATHGHFPEIVDNVLGLVRYTGGMDCALWFGKTALGHRNGLRARIFGADGSAEWYQAEPESVTIHGKRGETRILDRASPGIAVADRERYNRFKAGHPAGFIEAFANHYYDIADALHSYLEKKDTVSPYVFSARAAWEGLVTLEAIADAADSRTWRPVLIR